MTQTAYTAKVVFKTFNNDPETVTEIRFNSLRGGKTAFRNAIRKHRLELKEKYGEGTIVRAEAWLEGCPTEASLYPVYCGNFWA